MDATQNNIEDQSQLQHSEQLLHDITYSLLPGLSLKDLKSAAVL